MASVVPLRGLAVVALTNLALNAGLLSIRSDTLLPFVERDAGPNPRLVLVEIDPHHFPLTHSNQVIEQDGFAAFRPDKHHPQFRF